jgi:hypothetical protein
MTTLFAFRASLFAREGGHDSCVFFDGGLGKYSGEQRKTNSEKL